VREIIEGKTHWRMLELIHEYAVSKLSNENRTYTESLRVEYYLKTIRGFKTFEEKQEYFQFNFSNFHAALKWTITAPRADLGFQLASELEGVWSSLGYFKEALNLLGQLLDLPADIEPARRANFLQSASDIAWQQHDFETAITYSKEAVELGRKHKLKREYPWYLNRLGRIYIEQGKLAEAKKTLNEALTLAHDDPSIMNPGSPLAQLGEVAFFEGRLDVAKALFEKALKHLTHSDDIFIAIAKTDLAEIALAQGEFEKAREWLRQALPYAGQQARRFIVLLSALAGYLVLWSDGSKQKAAQLYGALESLSAHSGVMLGLFYQNLNRARMEIAQRKLSAQEWQKAFETGRGWDRGEVIRQAAELLANQKDKGV
jgi:tetratricopeptide (TPR) repeat protein